MVEHLACRPERSGGLHHVITVSFRSGHTTVS